jgi:septal ring factor EnvC (AmiA/AmiB activator)
MPSVECLAMLINSGNFQTAADVDMTRAFISVHKGIKDEIEELKADLERASEDRAANLVMELKDERKEYERLRIMYDASVMENKKLAEENLALRKALEDRDAEEKVCADEASGKRARAD